MKRSFTLIEILVAITIIMIIAAIVIFSLGPSRARTRDAKRVSNLESIAGALEMYRAAHHGEYPATPADTPAKPGAILSDSSCDGMADVNTCTDVNGYSYSWDLFKQALQINIQSVPQDPNVNKDYTEDSQPKPYAYYYMGTTSNYKLMARLEENPGLMDNDGGAYPSVSACTNGGFYEVYTSGAKDWFIGELPVVELPTSHVYINEVYYFPDADHMVSTEDRYEWIELYNPTGVDIDISNWTLQTNEIGQTKIIDDGWYNLFPGKAPIIPAFGHAILMPYQGLVINEWQAELQGAPNFCDNDPEGSPQKCVYYMFANAQSPNFGPLNNNTDTIIIRDGGTEVDRISYVGGTQGFSINRTASGCGYQENSDPDPGGRSGAP